jgi:hypothetical protein
MSNRSAAIAVRKEDNRLPLLLRRPSAADPIAKLSYAERDDAENGTFRARWRLEGSPQVVMMATNIFSGAVSRKKDAVSWPAVEATFEDLLMLQHRFGIEIAPAAAEDTSSANYVMPACRASVTLTATNTGPSLFRRGVCYGQIEVLLSAGEIFVEPFKSCPPVDATRTKRFASWWLTSTPFRRDNTKISRGWRWKPCGRPGPASERAASGRPAVPASPPAASMAHQGARIRGKTRSPMAGQLERLCLLRRAPRRAARYKPHGSGFRNAALRLQAQPGAVPLRLFQAPAPCS